MIDDRLIDDRLVIHKIQSPSLCWQTCVPRSNSPTIANP